jgi:hypothetical protein
MGSISSASESNKHRWTDGRRLRLIWISKGASGCTRRCFSKLTPFRSSLVGDPDQVDEQCAPDGSFSCTCFFLRFVAFRSFYYMHGFSVLLNVRIEKFGEILLAADHHMAGRVRPMHSITEGVWARTVRAPHPS